MGGTDTGRGAKAPPSGAAHNYMGKQVFYMNKGRKVAILGAGNVGATIAFALTTAGLATEIVLIDIAYDKARGEAMDIIQARRSARRWTSTPATLRARTTPTS
jgi:3-hydroxyacyl-CoA dehydrogenase